MRFLLLCTASLALKNYRKHLAGLYIEAPEGGEKAPHRGGGLRPPRPPSASLRSPRRPPCEGLCPSPALPAPLPFGQQEGGCGLPWCITHNRVKRGRLSLTKVQKPLLQ